MRCMRRALNQESGHWGRGARPPPLTPIVGVLTGGEADSRITRLFMSDFSLFNVYLTTSRFLPQGTSEPIMSWTCLLSIILAERIRAAFSCFLKILLVGAIYKLRISSNSVIISGTFMAAQAALGSGISLSGSISFISINCRSP